MSNQLHISESLHVHISQVHLGQKRTYDFFPLSVPNATNHKRYFMLIKFCLEKQNF